MKLFEEFLTQYNELRKNGTSFVVITMVNAVGSTPQDIGSRAIITEEGLFWGTIGGGKVEGKAIEQALDLLKSENAQLYVKWNLQRDVGMTCGGEVSFFFEKFHNQSAWKVFVFGAGHVGQQLIRSLLPLDGEFHCIDHREEWLSKLPDAPNLQKHLLKDPKELVKDIPSGSFCILMTMGHSTDVPILNEILKHDHFPYVGVIGSKSKRNVMTKELKELNHSDKAIESFICPIGYKIGTNDPYEISISILAQLLEYRDKE
ncbi:MAG: xanthine dehydrogenase accessory protein XdhC [Oligoflexia bacterium]|nr:xanthine dehydrogenase accessory protein XdhC [Oligoflexia bacterium]